jgi:DNA topoisomerase II
MKRITYTTTPSSSEIIDMVFGKNRTDDRKQWLRAADTSLQLDYTQTNVTVDDFINREMILFSTSDNVRSIGSMVDGLKPSQRKVLFAAFKKNLTSSMQLAQFGGYVSANSCYHHGEASLHETMKGMAQTFEGARNLELLSPDGQFGTRLLGGADAASPRYIFTKLSDLVPYLFRKDDLPIVTSLYENGHKIDPEYYVPIIPFSLVNGMEGIGTGWSTSVPCYHAGEICTQFIARLEQGPSAAFRELVPFYRGFTGQIMELPADPTKPYRTYLTKGVYTITSHDTIEIPELPVGQWSTPYKNFLDSVVLDKENGFLKNVYDRGSDQTVKFVLECKPNVLTEWTRNLHSGKKAHIDLIEETLKLTSSISCSNMHMFNETRVLTKYDSTVQVMEAFFPIRLEYYRLRKQYMVDQLENKLMILRNKIRFIRAILDKTLPILKMTTSQVLHQLSAM